MKNPFLLLGFLAGFALASAGIARAQCYQSLLPASGATGYEHVVRLCVHFSDASFIPDDIICSRNGPGGESAIDVPIYAYNLHEGIEYLEFSIASNESLAAFVPGSCFSVVASHASRRGAEYAIDLAIQASGPTCGPVHVGSARVEPGSQQGPIWIDLVPNGQTGKMFALDAYGLAQILYTPHHGGFIGTGYLYACQRPLCEEPNAPVREFVAEKDAGCSTRLSWVAGGGNLTVVRFRTDRYPTDYQDGELAVETASEPGQIQTTLHGGFPEPAILYYKAFSLTRDAGGLITNTSFVECCSADTVVVNCQIAVGAASWGAIKSLFQ
jgi:hypothetical protein